MAGAMQVLAGTPSFLYVGSITVGTDAPTHQKGFGTAAGSKTAELDINTLVGTWVNTVNSTDNINFTSNPTCGTTVNVGVILNGVYASVPNQSANAWAINLTDTLNILSYSNGNVLPLTIWF